MKATTASTTDDDVAKRRDDALRWALSTPPKDCTDHDKHEKTKAADALTTGGKRGRLGEAS